MNVDGADRRVDHFWRKVFELRDVTGKERCQALQKVVMASLVIAHGNADAERGLSDNKRVVSKERTKMSLDNIIGIRATQDAVRFYDPKNENAARLPITRQLLVAVRNSHAAHKARLDAKKQECEKKKRAKEAADAAHQDEQRQQIAEKVALQEQDEELVKKQHEAQNILKTGEALLTDGNAKLTSALQAKDFQMASLAQAIIEAGQKKCKNAREQLEAIESKKKNINCKRKQQLPSASEPRHKKQGVPVKGATVNVTVVSNTVHHKTGENCMQKGQEKSSAQQKLAKQKTLSTVSVTKEVTSHK